uniref:Uncharacterized protein n=1 Tax=Arundo donax TaxID=35708 RepID=A0A0A8XU97_ARUDO
MLPITQSTFVYPGYPESTKVLTRC